MSAIAKVATVLIALLTTTFLYSSDAALTFGPIQQGGQAGVFLTLEDRHGEEMNFQWQAFIEPLDPVEAKIAKLIEAAEFDDRFFHLQADGRTLRIQVADGYRITGVAMAPDETGGPVQVQTFEILEPTQAVLSLRGNAVGNGKVIVETIHGNGVEIDTFFGMTARQLERDLLEELLASGFDAGILDRAQLPTPLKIYAGDGDALVLGNLDLEGLTVQVTDFGLDVDVAALVTFTEELARFVRGDVNGSGTFDGLADIVFLLEWAFGDGPEPGCLAAVDLNGDDNFHAIEEAFYGLAYWFQGGPEPSHPFPDCGQSTPTVEFFGCEEPVCP